MIKRYFKVVSSSVDQIGYDPKEEVLGVIFNGGAEYHYFNFRSSHWVDLCAADSIGKHFHAEIKNNFGWKKQE